MQEVSKNPYINYDSLRAETRRLRKQHALTQADLADRLGISQASVSAFERGKNRTLHEEVLNRLMELVGEWRKSSKIVTLHVPPYDADTNAVATVEEERVPSRHDSVTEDGNEVLESMRQSLITYLGEKRVDQGLVRGMSREELFRSYLLMQSIKE